MTEKVIPACITSGDEKGNIALLYHFKQGGEIAAELHGQKVSIPASIVSDAAKAALREASEVNELEDVE